MKNFENLIEKEVGLANGEITPRDRLQNQIRLATEVFCRLNGFANLDSEEERNKIMLNWTEKGYSEVYRRIEDSPEFKSNSRLKGNIYNITPDDMLFFMEQNKLPNT